MSDDDPETYFEGHTPRECREHRTLGSHRAWCFDCSQYCYPRIAAACNGCRNPVIEQLMDDLAGVLANYFDEGDGRFILADDPPLPDVVAVMARYRAYKETE